MLGAYRFDQVVGPGAVDWLSVARRAAGLKAKLASSSPSRSLRWVLLMQAWRARPVEP